MLKTMQGRAPSSFRIGAPPQKGVTGRGEGTLELTSSTITLVEVRVTDHQAAEPWHSYLRPCVGSI